MNKRQLVKALRDAAFAHMPPEEARKFRYVLGGSCCRSLPRDGLPPITINRPTRPRKARIRNRFVPDQLRLL